MLQAKPGVDKAELAELSVAQLRDELLACDPVNTDWVVQINRVWCLSPSLSRIKTKSQQHLAVHDHTPHTSCLPLPNAKSKGRERGCQSMPVLLQAEAEYWRRSEGYRIGWSDQILGFDCGGQQWVLEVAFPTGTLK